ncbi:unnamed protein product [Ectocarpus sp. 12 AP-2014]
MSSFFMDGRFTDAWVVDRTLFEHLSGGACSCCGLSHHNLAAFMQDCSDIETDDGRKERKSPWPPAMSDEVWTARVKLRAAMKGEMPRYHEFWGKHAQIFSEWWTRLPAEEKRRTLSMPVDEVPVTFQGKYDLRGAYFVVINAVNDQLRNFQKTGIKGDGRTAAELSFEEGLKVHRGAYLGGAFVKDTQADRFYDMCRQVGGPRLLPSKPRDYGTATPSKQESSTSSAEDSTNERVDFAEIGSAETEGQSFRADRRLIRLVVFRYMFDKAIRKFQADTRKEEKVGTGQPSSS